MAFTGLIRIRVVFKVATMAVEVEAVAVVVEVEAVEVQNLLANFVISMATMHTIAGIGLIKNLFHNDLHLSLSIQAIRIPCIAKVLKGMALPHRATLHSAPTQC